MTLPILPLDHNAAAFTVFLPLGAFRNMIIYRPNWKSLIAEVAIKRLFLLFFFFFFFFSIVRFCQILPTLLVFFVFMFIVFSATLSNMLIVFASSYALVAVLANN